MSSKRKTLKLAAVITCAALSISTLFITGCGKTVNTYAVDNIAMIDDWMGTSETSGEVHTHNMQTVYITDTQTVTEICVTEGQSVKKGDKLMAFDTTLTDIEVEKKELEVMQLELAYQEAKNDLARINSYKPMVVTTITPDVPEAGAAVNGYMLLSGDGTAEAPFVYVVENGRIPCDAGFIGSICTPGAESVWAVYQTRAGNTANGPITEYTGICYSNSVSGLTMSFFDASEFCQQEPTEPYEEVEVNSGFTAAEISQMRVDAKAAIEEAEYKYRMADLDYRKMVLEMDSGVVTAEQDSVVVTVNDPETALEKGDPLLKLSADGGYVVEGTLSELELGTVNVGQKVKVTSWEHYAEYEAEINSISTVPAAQNGWTNGNNNVSYYPFTVYIDGSADMMEYEWVSIAYSSSGTEDDGFYLENAFILKEGGRSYVFAQDDKGTLEKREIRTGGNMWGSYTKILGGLTLDDRIAFPYDKNAKPGVKTVEAGLEELYSYYG